MTCRWKWAVRKLVLRNRSDRGVYSVMEKRTRNISALTKPFTSFFGMQSLGPQISAFCTMPPAVKYPGHPDYRPPPPCNLQIMVCSATI